MFLVLIALALINLSPRAAPFSKVVATRRVHSRTILGGDQAVGHIRSDAHPLVVAVLVPDVHHDRVAGQQQRLVDVALVKEVVPVFPVHRVARVDREHAEVFAARARHQRRVLGVAHAMQDARDDARSVVAPRGAVEAVLKLSARVVDETKRLVVCIILSLLNRFLL